MKISFLLVAGVSFLPVIIPAAANADISTDKKRSVQLVQKWSLPFQGQLAAVSAVNTQKMAATVPTAKGNDLALFKPKEYAVLTIAPPLVSGQNLIASADAIDPTVSISKNGNLITGGVSAWDGPLNVDRIINYLVDTHFENSPEGPKTRQTS